MRNSTMLVAGVMAMAMAMANDPSVVLASEPQRQAFNFIVEIAGADETDAATDDELRKSGLPMVPAAPSADARDPLKTPPQPEATASPNPSEKAPLPKAQADENNGSTQPSTPTIQTTAEPVKAEPEMAVSTRDYYLRIDGGGLATNDPDGAGRNGTHQSSSIDDSFLVSLGIGMPLDTNIRGDVTVTYRNAMDISGTDGIGQAVSGEVDSYGAMVNLYYDFTQLHDLIGRDTITPYIGAGLGLSYLGASDLTTVGAATERDAYAVDLAYAGMAGVSAQLTDSLAMDVGYRLINLGQFEHDGTFSDGSAAKATEYDDLIAHEFRAGFRFQF